MAEGGRKRVIPRAFFNYATFSLPSRTNGCIIQGLPAPIVGAMAENASLFLAYEELQNLIRLVTHRPVQEEKLPLHYLALAAAGAGATTSFLLSVSTTSYFYRKQPNPSLPSEPQ